MSHGDAAALQHIKPQQLSVVPYQGMIGILADALEDIQVAPVLSSRTISPAQIGHALNFHGMTLLMLAAALLD